MKWISLTMLFGLTISCSEVSNNKPAPTANVFDVRELNTQQLDTINKDKAVVLLVGGILEEHGPHLPSFTDGYWNERFADTLATIIASKTDRVVLKFPIIPLGNSGANDIGRRYSFPGTYTVRQETLRAVYMDLAVELGEQGFKDVIIINGHGAPNHQRALDQAADFFNDTYQGRMINLFGFMKVQEEWMSVEKSREQAGEDGMKVHAGMDEASAAMFLKPALVDRDIANARSLGGRTMNDLVAIARERDWPGYFGAEKLATREAGKIAWNKNVDSFSGMILDILEGRIQADTITRFGNILATSKEDAALDSLSLVEETRRKAIQSEWLKSHNLN